nr:hypothetical protein [Chromohalobacter moromii]
MSKVWKGFLSTLVDHTKRPALYVLDLVEAGRLIFDAAHAHDGFQGGVVDALVDGAAHARDHAPLGGTCAERLVRLAVLRP